MDRVHRREHFARFDSELLRFGLGDVSEAADSIDPRLVELASFDCWESGLGDGAGGGDGDYVALTERPIGLVGSFQVELALVECRASLQAGWESK